MSTNPIAVGDRVMLIPFQHKGKIATVKYYGSIEKKFGTWVGLELDEPTGDSSGEVNGEQLFDCK
jgi:dynactin complex subunit